MRVWYVTMTFPAPSETFACNDVRALSCAGVDISVHALRFSRKEISTRLLKERKLSSLLVTHNSGSAMLCGLKIAVKRPKVLFYLLSWIGRYNWQKPNHLWKSLVLVPRALDIFAQVEKHQPDVVHVYWGHYPSLVGYLVKTYLPDTVVSISLAAYDLEMEYGGSGPVAEKADMVRTQAKVNAAQIERVFGIPRQRVNVIYDGIDFNHAQGVDFKSKKIPRRIVAAGRLVPSKGMDDVLRAFQGVLSRWPDASLVVLGDGPDLKYLQTLTQTLSMDHAVTFKGHVRHEEVFEEMSQAEVFLFMSRDNTERLPNVVKEAMASECLCVVSDTKGIRELLPNDEYGFVVPIGGVSQATARVVTAFNDVKSTAARTTLAKAHVQTHFDLAKTTKQYLETWQESIDYASIKKTVTHFNAV